MNNFKRFLYGIIAAGSVAAAQDPIIWTDSRLLVGMVIAFAMGLLNSTDKMPKIPKGGKQALILFVAIGVMLPLSGCETFKAAKTIPAPQNFQQKLAIAYGQLSYVRAMTAFNITSLGYDCINKHFDSSTCKNAREVDKKTKEIVGQLELIEAAYGLSGGDLSKCKIEYGGQVLPCQSRSDMLLAILLELQRGALIK